MQIKAVFLDLDGAIVGSNDQHILAWEEAFAGGGASFERQTIHDQIGKGTDMLVPALLPEADEAQRTNLGEMHGTIFSAKYLNTIRPLAQTHDLVRYAHNRGQRVILASSASKSKVAHYIDFLDASDLIAEAASGDPVEKTKPAPDAFAAAIEKLPGIAPAEIVVVGDTPYNIEAANRCGIAAIAVRSGGFLDEQLQSVGVITIYNDVAALLAGYATSPLGR